MAMRGIGPPPSREDTHDTLSRPPGSGGPPGKRGRRKKSGRTEQFNSRVQAGFKERVKNLAEREKETVGAFVEKLVAEYEARGASLDGNVIPAAEARAGRTAELRVWCSPSVFQAVPKLAAERGVLVPELIEDLVAREVERLDPHGGKFGVKIEK
jgi:hypothetical protein